MYLFEYLFKILLFGWNSGNCTVFSEDAQFSHGIMLYSLPPATAVVEASIYFYDGLYVSL